MAGALAVRIDSITKRAGIRSRDVARLLDTTPETITRWRQGRAEPRQDRLQRLLTLEWLVTELSEFYPPKEAKLWLFSPHRLLNGETPEKRIHDGKLDDVLALIEQLKTGAYV